MENSAKKKGNISNTQKSFLEKTFSEILHSMKLYHWKTKPYSRKETDQLHEKISEATDRFIEVLIGKTPARIQKVEDKIKLYDFDNKTQLKDKIFEFRQFLIDLNHLFPSKKNEDLLSIRDEMLESVNQFLYFFTVHG